MTKRKTSIQINGKHYDAITGALLSYEETPVPRTIKPAAKSIDGVIGGAKGPIKPVHAHQAVASPSKPKPVKPHQPASHAKARQVKPSAALMRHAVAKPTTAPLKRHTKVHHSTHNASHIVATSKYVVVPKTSLHGINHQRAARASAITKSPHIIHFAQELSTTISRDIEQTVAAIDKAIVVPQTFTPTGQYRPDIRRAQPRRQATSSDIFEQALLKATSHEQPAPVNTPAKKRRSFAVMRRRMVSFGAGAVAVLAMVGVFGYHGDTIQFKVATSRAGFAATRPAYQPKGYTITSIQASSGYVNLRYVSPTNIDGIARSYALTEKPTSWDSETLLSNITASKNATNYSAIKKAGRTIYVYGKNQAAWVHNGILYQVLGSGSLSSNDVIAIATSM